MKEAVSVTKILLHDRKASDGTIAKHVHKCGHECDSSYCEEPRDHECENCGGPESIIKGREPWRGR